MKSETMKKVGILLLTLASVSSIGAQDRSAYLMEHGWGVQNVDLVPLPDAPITFGLLSDLQEDINFVKRSFQHLNNYYETYRAWDGRIEPLTDESNLLSYEVFEDQQLLQLTLVSYNLRVGSYRRMTNPVSVEFPLEGIWRRTALENMNTEFRYVDSQKIWDHVLSVPDGYPEIWPRGTHLVRWIDENTLETDSTFGNRIVFEVIDEHPMMREDQFWLRMISPIENPANVFEGDLILNPVLHPDQWTEDMRSFP